MWPAKGRLTCQEPSGADAQKDCAPLGFALAPALQLCHFAQLAFVSTQGMDGPGNVNVECLLQLFKLQSFSCTMNNPCCWPSAQLINEQVTIAAVSLSMTASDTECPVPIEKKHLLMTGFSLRKGAAACKLYALWPCSKAGQGQGQGQ